MNGSASRLLLVCVGGALATQSAVSAEWALVSESSRLTFTAVEQGAPFEGRFESFSASVDFDSSDPSSGRIIGVIDTASVDSGNSERDEMLLDKNWFDAASYPQARFESERLERTGDGTFRAHAQLTLRDETRPVVMDFKFSESGSMAHLSGTVELKRLEFGVGQGAWTDTELASDEVTVILELDLIRD